MIILNSREARELDRISQSRYGIESYALMTRAGECVADATMRLFAERAKNGVLAVAGKGNNGGDAIVAARRLLTSGVAIRTVILARAGELRGDAMRAYADFVGAGGQVREAVDEGEIGAAIDECTGVIIDGIFGTGLNAEVRGLARSAIEAINASKAAVVAVDIASGVDTNTGAILGCAVRADLTVTFGYAKFGHVSFPGAANCGELRIFDIGFAPQAIDEIAPRGRMLTLDEVRPMFKPRAPDAHKGNFGHTMIVAGSVGKSGAAVLAARAALRAGAGLVTLAVPASIQAVVASSQAEMMTEPIADRDGRFDGARAPAALEALCVGKTSLVVGPGIGATDDSAALIEWIIDRASGPAMPVLIDADGLNALAQLGAGRARRARGPVVLTPHPGEAARLLGISNAEVNANRIGAACRLSEITGAIVLLKGARSVIASPDGTVFVNSSGNPGMATAGMGDALSGIVGAMLGAGMSPLEALALSVWLHGRAGDRVASRMGRIGFIAGDLIDEIPATIEELSADQPGVST
jgi:NAD(P)H-hydrate epimerase